ncbi:HAMP domain-containing protein [Rhodobacteraceae bacterium 2CG4]|uniref:histidine kinase n=1 Tax=Halovulum marinum TaxID=2662447 RepID=A0A6L5YY29_9RHOB|nr:HAMP domain-containing sensor histidine kinase [Halovulum marinum]MSU88725.1 HAMP domain-containing protein [Halovulum marinum]
MSLPRGLWRTTPVRFAAVLTALFCLVLGGGLGAVYLGTVAVVDRQTEATLDAEIRALSERFEEGGLRRLVGAIEARTGPDARGDNVYLLVGPDGRRRAGNLSAWPAGHDDGAEISFPVTKRDGAESTERRVRALTFELPRGYRLLVGRDSEDQFMVRQRFVRAAVWVILFAIAVGLVSGVLLGRRVLRRVEAAAEAGERIAAGNLERRVPLAGSGDEFDRLAGSVNAMLDRIEGLMSGMRLATDAISHDVRKPLTRVRAELELALLRRAEGEDAQVVMTHALEQIDAAMKILANLLDIARAETRVPGDSWKPIDLATIAEDAAELYHPVAEARGIEVVLDTGPAPARGEPQLVAQAVANLIDNALKYAPAADGRVTVRAHPTDDGGACVEVADNGPGIPAEARATVADRFVRLDDARGGEGSGLGLSLVRAVAHLHGGRLELLDNAPGLRARIMLPPV